MHLSLRVSFAEIRKKRNVELVGTGCMMSRHTALHIFNREKKMLVSFQPACFIRETAQTMGIILPQSEPQRNNSEFCHSRIQTDSSPQIRCKAQIYRCIQPTDLRKIKLKRVNKGYMIKSEIADGGHRPSFLDSSLSNVGPHSWPSSILHPRKF